MLKQLAVDGAVERVEQGGCAGAAAWTYDREHYDGIVATRRREADIMRDYTRGRRCLMQLLQESLDDAGAAPCGRCSVCLGRLPEGLRERPSDETVAAVTAVLRGADARARAAQDVARRRLRPRGRIAPNLMAEQGRTIIFADAPEWRAVVRNAFARDGAAPDELKAAAVAVLGRWRGEWAGRPEVVVPLPASGFSALTRDVAGHLATVGRLDAADLPVDPSQAPSAPSRDLSSADEAAAWKAALSVDATAAQAVSGRRVLLVVDATSSLWPVTVAAAVLRGAGALAVMPLLVHRRP